jgi:hypothetical protein
MKNTDKITVNEKTISSLKRKKAKTELTNEKSKNEPLIQKISEDMSYYDNFTPIDAKNKEVV